MCEQLVLVLCEQLMVVPVLHAQLVLLLSVLCD